MKFCPHDVINDKLTICEVLGDCTVCILWLMAILFFSITIRLLHAEVTHEPFHFMEHNLYLLIFSGWVQPW